MAPRKKLLRASPKPTGRLVKKAKATGKPKGSSPSMVLGSASKAGMQSKQGRNFLLPKSKRPKILPGLPPRGKPEFDRGKPMPRQLPEKFMKKLKDLVPPKRKTEFERGTPLPRAADELDKFIKKLKTGPRPDPLSLTPEMKKKLRLLINDRKRKK